MKLIKPHGGTLINREIQGSEREELVRKATTLPKVQLSSRQVSDLLMLAIGGYSPLAAFSMRLTTRLFAIG
jgi:ATP sulfurylase (sulfate adenylyltransferase)